MMLQRGRARFNQRLRVFGSPTVFQGTIQPAPESSISVDTFALPRMLLRVDLRAPVAVSQVITDQAGRNFLVGDHDTHFSNGRPLDRVYRLFQMQEQVRWRREQTSIDLLTGLPRQSMLMDLGLIWVVREVYGRTEWDRGLRVEEERLRVVTGADVQLGDQIDDAVIRRLIPVFGVKLLEVQ